MRLQVQARQTAPQTASKTGRGGRVPPPPPPPPPPSTPPGVNRRGALEWILIGAGGLTAVGIYGVFTNISKLAPVYYDYEIGENSSLKNLSRFRYNDQGKLFLQQKNNGWMGVINDLKNPGRLLLRDEQGKLFFWDLYESDDMQQVDLTNQDLILEMMTSHPDWEKNLQPLPIYSMYKDQTASDSEFRKGIRYVSADGLYFWIPELTNSKLRSALERALDQGFIE